MATVGWNVHKRPTVGIKVAGHQRAASYVNIAEGVCCTQAFLKQVPKETGKSYISPLFFLKVSVLTAHTSETCRHRMLRVSNGLSGKCISMCASVSCLTILQTD